MQLHKGAYAIPGLKSFSLKRGGLRDALKRKFTLPEWRGPWQMDPRRVSKKHCKWLIWYWVVHRQVTQEIWPGWWHKHGSTGLDRGHISRGDCLKHRAWRKVMSQWWCQISDLWWTRKIPEKRRVLCGNGAHFFLKMLFSGGTGTLRNGTDRKYHPVIFAHWVSGIGITAFYELPEALPN